MLNLKGMRHFVATALILLMTAGSALATSFKFTFPAKVGDGKVEPGRYNVTWKQHSPELTITVKKGKEVVATSEGKLEKRDTRFSRNSVIYSVHEDGSKSIKELHVGGSNTAIVFE